MKIRPLPGGLLLAIVLGTLASACAQGSNEPAPESPLVIFPAPPDTPRIQFLTRFSSSLDIEEPRSSIWGSIIGQTEAEEEKIAKPYGISIYRGKIYICDTTLSAVEIIDLEARTFEYFKPRGGGTLRKPINCVVDQQTGNLFVADASRGQVVVFDTAGTYIAGFGHGAGAQPTDVFVERDRIWVSDLGNKQIHVYDKRSYDLLFSFPNSEQGAPGYLYTPTNIHVTDTEVYVSDFLGFQVQVYDRNGEYLRTVGSHGNRLGQFARPKGIAVDYQSNLYVVDAAFQNVQIFDREGQLLMFFGGGYAGPGYMWLPAKVMIDYDNLDYFRQYVHPSFDLKYLIFVTNQYGPDKVSVYGFVGPAEEPIATR
jgi:DNA-binding beta-propeller fold protein YncE